MKIINVLFCVLYGASLPGVVIAPRATVWAWVILCFVALAVDWKDISRSLRGW